MGKKILTLSLGEYADDFAIRQQTEVTVHLPDDVAWDKMLPFFLHFLEGAGYIGVVNKMSELLGGSVYDYETYFNRRVSDFSHE
jgi:hypothetical protein